MHAEPLQRKSKGDDRRLFTEVSKRPKLNFCVSVGTTKARLPLLGSSSSRSGTLFRFLCLALQKGERRSTAETTIAQNARRSPFLDIAPILEEQSTTCAILIQRVANSYEELARQYPTSDMAVQSHGEFAQQLYTSSNMMLPTLERLVLCLRQLREIADDVSRASGGLLSLTTEGSVSIDIERPDPEGGSHTITAREVLKVVHPESIRATAAKLRHNAQGFVDCGQKLEACAKRLLAGADQFLSTLEPVEMMVLQSAPRIPGPAPRESRSSSAATPVDR